MKEHSHSRRALALLLAVVLCFSLIPTAFAAQQNSYHDPAEHWLSANDRTNELDANAVVTHETFRCGECNKQTSFLTFRTPEYTKDGKTAMSRNVQFSDGTLSDGQGKGSLLNGTPGQDAYYTLPRRSAKLAAASIPTEVSRITAISRTSIGSTTVT